MHHHERLSYSAMVALLAVGVVACNDPTNASHALAARAVSSLAADKGGNGSGPTGVVPPSGSHFDLSINAVPQGDAVAMTGTDGRTIFVQLFGGDSASSFQGRDMSSIDRQDQIFIMPAPAGAGFQVLDANGTDASGASIQLPATPSNSYAVWARTLVQPTGQSGLSGCATVLVTDPATGVTSNEVDCPIGTVTIPRNSNANVKNSSSALLAATITVDAAANPTLGSCLGVSGTATVTVGLFNSCLQNVFWSTQSTGVQQLQLHFYPIS